jgi:hypothetical protein
MKRIARLSFLPLNGFTQENCRVLSRIAFAHKGWGIVRPAYPIALHSKVQCFFSLAALNQRVLFYLFKLLRTKRSVNSLQDQTPTSEQARTRLFLNFVPFLHSPRAADTRATGRAGGRTIHHEQRAQKQRVCTIAAHHGRWPPVSRRHVRSGPFFASSAAFESGIGRCVHQRGTTMRTATIEHLGEILLYRCVDPSRRAVGAQVREFSLEMAVSICLVRQCGCGNR